MGRLNLQLIINKPGTTLTSLHARNKDFQYLAYLETCKLKKPAYNKHIDIFV